MRGRLSVLIKIFLPLLLIMLGGINICLAQATPANPATPQIKPADLGEDPGPVYTKIVLKWAKVTNFAENAAQTIVGKFKLELENSPNPKLKQVFTPELKSDLEQFFYELFLAPETIKYLAMVYSQYFTLDDMEEMIKFYESPVGQKLIKAEPQLQIKTHQIGEMLLKEHKNDYLRIIGKHIAGQGKK